ncbi:MULTISPECIES: phosphoribosylanthranilate isomerase [Methylotenera]|uniref:phosphoribosylanthranilate isomerase n=1 Tax=Methylotenera TaxID=359407 RepID=UPI000360A316|nr:MULTISPECIES: phosphoribosylanthranilate isomerase [Methylotenera]
MRTRVKICGITNAEDARSAIKYGADAIGLVFYASSPRCVTITQAQQIVAAIPPFVSVVGLFVNATTAEIEAVLSQVHIDILQFHGDENAAECERIKLPYLKAIRVKNDTNLLQYEVEFSSAKALLLDTYSEAAFGGTGHVFDWKLIPENLKMPIILAGGLTAENVADAIKQVQPYAVDVSGGVEVSKGIKDVSKIADFMQAVNVSGKTNEEF